MLNRRSTKIAARIACRTSLAAAMLLPLAHPASAAREYAKALPSGARYAVAKPGTAAQAVTFRKLWARRSAKRGPHFQFPYGLGSDGVGNVFVTNYALNSVAMISPTLKTTTNVITQQVQYPVSVTVGADETIFVGNLGSASGGYVERYSGNMPQQTITANASTPYSIAADEFNDLYLATNAGIALDDPSGNLLYGPQYGGYGVISVAVGNADTYAFVDGSFLVGSASVFLRTAALQSIVGPSGATNPSGVACDNGDCWYVDTQNDSLTLNNGSSVGTTSLPYTPVGLAYDRFHSRVFVSDPDNNAIHVYNAETLALEKTLT